MSATDECLAIPEIQRLICKACDTRTDRFGIKRRAPTLARLARVSRAWFGPAVETLLGNGWGISLIVLVQKYLPNCKIVQVEHNWRMLTDNFGETYYGKFRTLDDGLEYTQEDWDRFLVYTQRLSYLFMDIRDISEGLVYKLEKLEERFEYKPVFPRLRHIHYIRGEFTPVIHTFVGRSLYRSSTLKTLRFGLWWEGQGEMQFIFDTSRFDHDDLFWKLQRALNYNSFHDLQQWKIGDEARPLSELFQLGGVPGLQHLDLLWHETSGPLSISNGHAHPNSFQSLTTIIYKGNHPTFPGLIREFPNAPLHSIRLNLRDAVDLIGPTLDAITSNKHVATTLQDFTLELDSAEISMPLPESHLKTLLSFPDLHRVMVRGVGLLVTDELLTKFATIWRHLEELSLHRTKLERISAPQITTEGLHTFLSLCGTLRQLSVGYAPNIIGGNPKDLETDLLKRFPHVIAALDPVAFSPPGSAQEDSSEDSDDA
ncbi:hypothetical protein DL96DRAFT_602017 [Flagelloscypha sp. PMI_526]|nr:hypothetical protein DL96DRAFT_602017 [Flagelloscypha sp. PMI_526]